MAPCFLNVDLGSEIEFELVSFRWEAKDSLRVDQIENAADSWVPFSKLTAGAGWVTEDCWKVVDYHTDPSQTRRWPEDCQKNLSSIKEDLVFVKLLNFQNQGELQKIESCLKLWREKCWNDVEMMSNLWCSQLSREAQADLWLHGVERLTTEGALDSSTIQVAQACGLMSKQRAESLRRVSKPRYHDRIKSWRDPDRIEVIEWECI